MINESSIHEEIKCRLKTGNPCYYSVQALLSYRLFYKDFKIEISGSLKNLKPEKIGL